MFTVAKQHACFSPFVHVSELIENAIASTKTLQTVSQLLAIRVWKSIDNYTGMAN